ncbi:XF1762 family protein [Desulfovirgula thermocuniculi]|uniref:XF1762 family protein n=1 Tax=Desulfovirgula thermocuniculi TaxID=348842 RepID=UPI0004126D75|nr:XF1762 family protein [Desulfovirgula thermocuniculi]
MFLVPDWDGQFRFSDTPPGPPPSAKHLEMRPVPYRIAQAFVERHHYLGYAPPGARACLGVWYGDRLVGVLVFGRPSARLEDQRHTLELTRMVLLDECPRNSESRALALAVKWVRRNMPGIRRLIAYADPGRGHQGTVYRAAGWRLVGRTAGGRWTRTGRSRRDAAAGPKLKFELIF